ncbi:ABC-2 family transporter [Actinocorallia herbida]|uniref:ABC-2 family transporter n=1 Tax=Actinocorallia herbida TaxID=58109 RepID=A0A3N1CYM9_9ACTN|nr:ABC transporter permease subunit [Actinocorallia herbida]ROO86380.1 ABC-2 family transporter [Actinocorallia herbida]
MIWLTLRQFRPSALVAGVMLAALAGLLALTGPGLADDWADGTAECAATGCDSFIRLYLTEHQTMRVALSTVVLLVPALIGLFWGAPLVARELEAGTHRLVWNQSVTRTRWLAVKLGVVGAASAAVSGLVSLAVFWWASPLDEAAVDELPRMSPFIFSARGIVPVAFAVFAFALGVAVGMVARRALVAMAVTLAVFAVVQVAMPLLVRPHLAVPVEQTVTVTPDNLAGLHSQGPGTPLHVSTDAPAGAWVLANETVDSSGRVSETVPLRIGEGPCATEGARGPSEQCIAAIGELGYRQRLVYHPAGRFWALQWAESGVYAGLTALLAGFSFWWLRRRVS